MKNRLWNLSKNHVLAIGIFFVISCIYCLPALKGLTLNQHDTLSWREMSQQSVEFKAQHGHYPLWTNSMFSGMPAYQIAMGSKHNVTIAHLHTLFTLFLPGPAGLFFLSCIGFYILCMVLRLRTWVSILGSISYAFASYSAVIIAVGHNTKFASMGYLPAVLAGILLLTQRKYVLGFVCTLLFTTLMAWQNHIQVMYYMFLVIGCMAVAYAIQAIRQKEIKHLLLSLSLGIIAIAISIASFSVVLLPTRDYAVESMRGGRSELTDSTTKGNKTKGGLDKDYAFMWSYGKLESFTLIVPRIYGGSSGSAYGNELGNKSKSADVLIRRTSMDEENAKGFVQGFPTYWGAQPSTSGTVYLGAVICFLFIMALTFYRGWHLGWIVAASIIGIVLAWGKNFSDINYFLFDVLPYYNKFRAPTISLIIPQLTFPLLAVLGLNQLITEKEKGNFKALWKKFKVTGLITGAVFVILVGLYFSMDYKGVNDGRLRDNLTQQYLGQVPQGQQPTAEQMQQANDFARAMVNGLIDDRRSLYGGDLTRSLIFIILAGAIIALYLKDKVKAMPVMVALAILSAIDLLAVDARYLAWRNYKEEEEFTELTPNSADLQIKQDTGYYRVYDYAGGDPFQDARASYFHNSIGGYHAAKLALYDDLAKEQLSRGNMRVFNMLNAKWFIVSNPQNGQPVAQQNPGALGPVWLVKSLKYVNDANEEMKALDTFEPKDTAILDKDEQPKVTFTPQFDSTATIKLVKNLNDKINYEFNASSNQFAVFSEIYYPNGWKAFIDNKQTPIVKVNYLLRGLPIPAGKHNIEFRFEPDSFVTGDLITLITGIISILVLLFGIWYEWKEYRKNYLPASALKESA